MNQKSATTFRSACCIAVLLTLLMAMTCVAGAAFYPRIISWFTNQYGQEWGAWMEKGNAALPDSAVEVNGAVYTIDEVLVRGRGLYVLGHISAEDGHVLVEWDSNVCDPFGYNIHYGEEAPDGTPAIAEKAAETNSILHYVACNLEGIGVDGGTILQPDCWGYEAKVQRDGNIVFSMEVEDGVAVDPGKEYTLAMRAASYGVLEDGSITFSANFESYLAK